MMKTIAKYLSFCLLASPLLLQAEIVVITHIENSVSVISKTEIQSIFMGRTRAFANGIKAVPYDFSVMRGQFYPLLTKRSVRQIDAYWARIVFSGQGMPPVQLTGAKYILSAVQENKGAIAYIDRDSIKGSKVRVLFSLE